MNTKKRYVSLDVLRGLTVALMIIVNNPGSWSKVFPFLRHAPWDGCTPCDLVFPFFLFCVGVSMTFAFAKFSSLTGDAFAKVLKRGVLMYLVGLGLTAFPFYPSQSAMDPGLSFWQNWLRWASHLRLVGVLARIAMCYVLGAILVLWLRKPLRISVAIGVLSVVYIGGLLLFAGPEGAFSLEGNFARKVDLVLLGENHMYHGYGVAFDPEGLWGVLTGTCTVLLGYLVGLLVREAGNTSSPESRTDLSARLFTLSACSLLSGLILSVWMPISKPLWSVSYVFYSGGWAMFVFAFLIYVIDVKGIEKPFMPFKALGMNALALFVVSGLIMKILWRYTDWDYTAVFGTNEYMSLLFALIYLAFHLLLALLLYRKKIFIKL